MHSRKQRAIIATTFTCEQRDGMAHDHGPAELVPLRDFFSSPVFHMVVFEFIHMRVLHALVCIDWIHDYLRVFIQHVCD